MLSEKMLKELNDQINAEMFSSYLYLSMAAYFEHENWDGMAAWMKAQSSEEYEHALKFYKYINDLDKKVTLEAIEKPKTNWNSPLEVFEEALQHELYITDRINKLVALADKENDYATKLFLNWFVNEQVEEVSTVSKIIHKFKLVGDSKTSHYLLDRELGMRGSK